MATIKYTIQTETGPKEVEGTKMKNLPFAYRRPYAGAASVYLDHLPSGRSAGHFLQVAGARCYAAALNTYWPDCTASQPVLRGYYGF